MIYKLNNKLSTLLYLLFLIIYCIFFNENIYFMSNFTGNEIKHRTDILMEDYINLLEFFLKEYSNNNIKSEEYFLIKNYYLKYNINFESIKNLYVYKMLINDINFNIEYMNWLNEVHDKNNFVLNWKEWQLCQELLGNLKNLSDVSTDYDTIMAIYDEMYKKQHRYKEFKDFKDFVLYSYIIEIYYNNINLNPAMIRCIILDTYKYYPWKIDAAFIAEIYLKFQNKIKLKSLYSNDCYNYIIKDCYNLILENWRKEMKSFIEEKTLNRAQINRFKILNKLSYFIYPTDLIELYIKYFKEKIDEKLFIEILYYHIINDNQKKVPILEMFYLINELPKDAFRENWTINDYYNFYYFAKYSQWGAHIPLLNDMDLILLDKIYYLKVSTIEETYILYKEMLKYNIDKYKMLGLKIQEYVLIEKPKPLKLSLKNWKNLDLVKLKKYIIFYYNNKEWIYIKKLILSLKKN